MNRRGYVYVLASQKNGTLQYGSDVGSCRQASATPDRDGLEVCGALRRHSAGVDEIAREKAIKKWPRRWKIKLIEENNPDWRYGICCDGGVGAPSASSSLAGSEFFKAEPWIPDTLRSLRRLGMTGCSFHLR